MINKKRLIEQFNFRDEPLQDYFQDRLYKATIQQQKMEMETATRKHKASQDQGKNYFRANTDLTVGDIASKGRGSVFGINSDRDSAHETQSKTSENEEKDTQELPNPKIQTLPHKGINNKFIKTSGAQKDPKWKSQKITGLPFKKRSKLEPRKSNLETYQKLKVQRTREYSINKRLHEKYMQGNIKKNQKDTLADFQKVNEQNTGLVQSNLQRQKMALKERIRSRREKSISKARSRTIKSFTQMDPSKSFQEMSKDDGTNKNMSKTMQFCQDNNGNLMIPNSGDTIEDPESLLKAENERKTSDGDQPVQKGEMMLGSAEIEDDPIKELKEQILNNEDIQNNEEEEKEVQEIEIKDQEENLEENQEKIQLSEENTDNITKEEENKDETEPVEVKAETIIKQESIKEKSIENIEELKTEITEQVKDPKQIIQENNGLDINAPIYHKKKISNPEEVELKTMVSVISNEETKNKETPQNLPISAEKIDNHEQEIKQSHESFENEEIYNLTDDEPELEPENLITPQKANIEAKESQSEQNDLILTGEPIHSNLNESQKKNLPTVDLQGRKLEESLEKKDIIVEKVIKKPNEIIKNGENTPCKAELKTENKRTSRTGNQPASNSIGGVDILETGSSINTGTKTMESQSKHETSVRKKFVPPQDIQNRTSLNEGLQKKLVQSEIKQIPKSHDLFQSTPTEQKSEIQISTNRDGPANQNFARKQAELQNIMIESAPPSAFTQNHRSEHVANIMQHIGENPPLKTPKMKKKKIKRSKRRVGSKRKVPLLNSYSGTHQKEKLYSLRQMKPKTEREMKKKNVSRRSNFSGVNIKNEQKMRKKSVNPGLPRKVSFIPFQKNHTLI